MQIKNIIKSLRNKSNKNQKELGAIIGVSASSIGMYEAGKRVPPPDVLIKLADYFGCTIDYLLGRTYQYQIKNINNPTIAEENKLEDYNLIEKIKSHYNPVMAEIVERLDTYTEKEQIEFLGFLKYGFRSESDQDNKKEIS